MMWNSVSPWLETTLNKKSCKIILLTTETPHHAYFAQELQKRFGLDGILLETRSLQAPFPTAHPFEADRDRYERDVLLNGSARPMPSIAESFLAESRLLPSCNT